MVGVFFYTIGGMMMNETKQIIIQAFSSCIDKIDKMLSYYYLLKEQKSTVFSLTEDNVLKTSVSIINKFYDKSDISITYLNKSKANILMTIDDYENLNFANIQFEDYIRREFLNYNWSQLSYLDNYSYQCAKNLFERIGQPLNNEDFNGVSAIDFMVTNSDGFKNILIGKGAILDIFKKISHINNNIVMIGANGSGKSTFARNLKGKLGNQFAIISAQHLLVYRDVDNITIAQSSIENVRQFQNNDKLGSDNNLINLLTNDFSNLVKALLEDKSKCEHEYFNGGQKPNAILDNVINIWQSLIPHRRIINPAQYVIKVQTIDEDIYSFNNLSDGEKAIFYYIGHVLLAHPNSYIVIDEPENHLHLSVCTKLWDILENVRSDCKFIYITHNIEFAVSRNNKTILWNKNFTQPFNWDYEEIESDDTIPDILLLEIMGCRKHIIFCEGDNRNSLDYKIYNKLFPDYNVIPVEGHLNVINYCKSFNNNRALSGIEAYGIVDGDAWSSEEIRAMNENKIMVLPYNEIENFICDIDILSLINITAGGNSQSEENYKTALFKIVESDKENQATWYANNCINNYLKHNMFKQNQNIDMLVKEVNDVLSEDKIKSMYEKRVKQIEQDLTDKNYSSLIRYINFKKRLSRELANRYIINNYEDRIINLLDSNCELKELIYSKLAFTLLNS